MLWRSGRCHPEHLDICKPTREPSGHSSVWRRAASFFCLGSRRHDNATPAKSANHLGNVYRRTPDGGWIRSPPRGSFVSTARRTLNTRGANLIGKCARAWHRQASAERRPCSTSTFSWKAGGGPACAARLRHLARFSVSLGVQSPSWKTTSMHGVGSPLSLG